MAAKATVDIENHLYVGAEKGLCGDGVLGREIDEIAVVRGPERHAVVGHLGSEREHLIAAGVGQGQWARRSQTHERGDTAEPCHHICPGPKHEVVRVGQQHLRSETLEVNRVDGAHRGPGPHRHEARRRERTSGQGHPGGARRPVERLDALVHDRTCGHEAASGAARSTSIASPNDKNRYCDSSAVAYTSRQRGPMNASSSTSRVDRGWWKFVKSRSTTAKG